MLRGLISWDYPYLLPGPLSRLFAAKGQPCSGSIFRSENDIYSPPPSENDIYSPSRDTSFFDSHRGLFALILPYFAFILPCFFFILIFFPLSSLNFPLSSFFFPLSSFFFNIFPLFLFPFSYFFPQMTSADISPPRGGGGVF